MIRLLACPASRRPPPAALMDSPAPLRLFAHEYARSTRLISLGRQSSRLCAPLIAEWRAPKGRGGALHTGAIAHLCPTSTYLRFLQRLLRLTYYFFKILFSKVHNMIYILTNVKNTLYTQDSSGSMDH